MKREPGPKRFRITLILGIFVTSLFCAANLLCARRCAAQSSSSGSSSSSGQSPAQQDEKAQKSEETPGKTKLKIRVTGPNDKPIGNASVYVRFYESGGFLHHDKLAELGLKTNDDGSVKVPPIPQGKILIQVVAPGWHTYGKWYDIEKDEELVEIKLEPPPHWY